MRRAEDEYAEVVGLLKLALQTPASPQDAADKHELLAEADRCLFQSKTEGKNRITFAELEQAA